MGFGNLAKVAQQMQADMARVENELQELRLQGSAGGGAVTAVVSGRQDLISVTIDPGVVDPTDVEMLQDLVVAAVADALQQARQTSEEKLARVTNGLRIPGM